MNRLSTWSILVLTLSTENATARMRDWHALKAKGCTVLRDGIYLLPNTDEREDVLHELAQGIIEKGGAAHLLRASSLNASQEADFHADPCHGRPALGASRRSWSRSSWSWRR